MTRNREIAIMVEALREAGLAMTGEVTEAVREGFKRIRIEKRDKSG